MEAIGDTTMATAAAAMRGLAARANVRADNIANANTPDYRAGAVNFESTLKSALRDGQLSASETSTAVTIDRNVPGPHQNLVSVEGEMVGMMKDQLMRNAMVNAYNFKITAFRTALGSR
ncbi:MAG: flagellar basal-body rod protein FlgB [Nitriliruptoraceae bacterium]|jgi:flagellar basal-body rod protein FlgB